MSAPESTTGFDDDVQLFVNLLTRSRDWITSDDIIDHIVNRLDVDGGPKRFTKTYLRHLAKAANGRILSGQKGYKATAAGTIEEIQTEAAALLKAANGIMDRRKKLLYFFHHGRAVDDRKDGQDETENDNTNERGS